MLYTKKGDNGTTKIFSSGERLSKSSQVTETLGTLDEINSWLGLCKIKSQMENLEIDGKSIAGFLEEVQHNLFIIQAEIAGADKHLTTNAVLGLEEITDKIEKNLPPIKTFFLAGGCELSAIFDIARTICRRAEREVVRVKEGDSSKVADVSLSYLNRLSSGLYAFTRLANLRSGAKEESPRY